MVHYSTPSTTVGSIEKSEALVQFFWSTERLVLSMACQWIGGRVRWIGCSLLVMARMI